MPRDDREWIHPAPRTFPLQGAVEAGGLAVGAPGLLEAEVDAEGTIALTLVRSVGWLSRPDLRTRPGEAGPSLPTPGAQCLGEIELALSLHAAPAWRAAGDAECGLVASGAGTRPLLPPDSDALSVTPDTVHLSALKPAEAGGGVVLRLLNTSGAPVEARVALGPDFAAAIREIRAVRLDETAEDAPFRNDGATLHVPLGPHALRSIHLAPHRSRHVRTARS